MDSNRLFITNVSIKKKLRYNELSALLDGEKIYLRVPDTCDLNLSVEFFVSVALLEGMISGRPLSIDNSIPLSSRVYEKLGELQAIYSCWNSDLSPINIEARHLKKESSFENVGLFFSAGVDSSHSLIRNFDEVSHLIILNCFDYGRDRVSWEYKIDHQMEFANSIGKKVIPIETNVRLWAENKRISWEFFHGLILSSVGGALGMKKVYIPSSHTYDELFPWGSHPLTDPMWSTESTEVIHDGAGYRRGQKMVEILSNPLIAENLHVCWKSIKRNCGECPKCVRTMIAAYLLDQRISSFPDLKNLKRQLKLLKATDESGATFLEDAMLLSLKTGNIEINKILKRYYKLYHTKAISSLIDRYVLGGFFKKLYRRGRKPKWLSARVTLRGRK